MKSTRRRLLTTLTGLIALPVLPRAASIVGDPPPSPSARSLRDCLASLHYPPDGEVAHRGHFDAWETTPRHPFTLADIESREEFIHCELHGQKISRERPHIIRQLESTLDECKLARRILEIQPTGRPLTFRYTGGTTPHRERTVLPTLLFITSDPHSLLLIDRPPTPLDPIYLHAYCIDRLAPRTFRLDRIENVSPLCGGDQRSPT